MSTQEYESLKELLNEFKQASIERDAATITLLNAHYKSHQDILSEIKAQTTKTNGRVTEAEKEIQELKISHLADCPYRNDVEARFINKHPKLIIAGIVVAVFLAIAAFVNDNPLKVFMKTPVKTEIIK